jgi:phosphatidylinositol-3-phosphatase
MRAWPGTGGRFAAGLALVGLVVACASAPAPATVPAPPSATSVPSIAASGSASTASASASDASPGVIPAYRHVYLVVMENQEYGSIVGSPAAPYLNGLIAGGGLVTTMDAETHPSQGNYVALTSGGLQGVTSDGAYDLDVPNLFDQVEAGGRTWHVYAQGYPGACSTAAFGASVIDGPGAAGQYARKHDPAISYLSIRRNPGRCARITGLAGFDPAAADLELIVPNQVNDMHDSSVAAGDAFLAAFVPTITGSPAFAGSILVITWDEGTGNEGGGGHVATIVVGAGIAAGSRLDRPASHYSILRMIEDAWGLPRLGGAGPATPIVFGP